MNSNSISGLKPEIYNYATNTWSDWGTAPVQPGDQNCMVQWRDSFILLGGSGNPRGVQLYNITTNIWYSLNIMPPVTRVAHSCAPIPGQPDQFLVVGGLSEPQNVAIYDANIDTWTSAAKTNVPRRWAEMVVLGSRVFVIGGHDGAKVQDSVEEYLVSKNVWEVKSAKLFGPRHIFGALAVPADLFAPVNIFAPLPGDCIGV